MASTEALVKSIKFNKDIKLTELKIHRPDRQIISKYILDNLKKMKSLMMIKWKSDILMTILQYHGATLFNFLNEVDERHHRYRRYLPSYVCQKIVSIHLWNCWGSWNQEKVMALSFLLTNQRRSILNGSPCFKLSCNDSKPLIILFKLNAGNLT